MVTLIEIIANLIIVAFAMAAIALIVALISLAATLFGKKFKPFFKKGLWFTLLAPLLFAYGIFIERNQCQVVNVNIESKKVPESFNDYKIVQYLTYIFIHLKAEARHYRNSSMSSTNRTLIL